MIDINEIKHGLAMLGMVRLGELRLGMARHGKENLYYEVTDG